MGQPRVEPRGGSGSRKGRSLPPVLCAAVAVAAACALRARCFAVPSVRSPTAAKAQVTSSALRRAATEDGRGPDHNNEWRMNVGHAIEVLEEDVVGFFETEGYVPDFSIYSEDIEFVDAHMPSLHINGLGAYRSTLSAVQWSLHTAFEQAQMQITSLSPPIHNTVMMRWRLDLLPRDALGPVKDFVARLFHDPSMVGTMPVTVEGYSHYEFDPWSGEIVKHTVDVKNPPTFLSELLKQAPAQSEVWSMPGVSIPGVSVPRGYYNAESAHRRAFAARPTAYPQPLRLAGATAPQLRRGARAPLSPRLAGAFMPQTCEDDFECNDGKANYPLQCCELPILGSFCCEPPNEGGFMVPQNNRPAYVPLPVPVEDPRPPM